MNNFDINFIFEIGTLRHVPRTWRQFGGADFANVTEHTFRVMWLSALLAKRENADIGKAIQLAFVHDLAECRTGDVHYLSRMYTKIDDIGAINDMLKNTTLSEIFIEIYKEAEEKKTIESLIVKDADILDCDFELIEQFWKGNKLAESWSGIRELAHKKLKTNSAKEIAKEIYNHSPHDWHILGVNRATSGDWSPTQEELD